MDYTKYEHKLKYVFRNVDPNAWNAYREETLQLVELFKQDLFIDLGIENNPKREKLFRLAWEMGHSSGYSEVVGIADELVDLIV